jgi:hypothetical protein
LAFHSAAKQNLQIPKAGGYIWKQILARLPGGAQFPAAFMHDAA